MNTQPTHRRPRQRARGFTLVEVMVVIVILGLLATIVGANVIGASDEAKIDKAKADIAALEDGVNMWLLRRSKTIPDNLEMLAEETDGKSAILDAIPLDPWDNEYVIEPDASGRQNKCVILSYGPDGEQGTEDDIRSDTMNARKER